MALMPHHTWVWQIISGVGWGDEVPYILVGQPPPGRLLGGIVTGAKLHSTNFSE